MSVTILEALLNADFNLRGGHGLATEVAKEQLHNAATLLDKGYGTDEEVEPLLKQYGSVENVPEK